MKLSRREKFLLIFMLVFAIAAGFYYFIFTPVSSDISSMTKVKNDLDMSVQLASRKLSGIEAIKKTKAENESKIKTICESFYADARQQTIMRAMGNIMAAANVFPLTISYGTNTDVAVPTPAAPSRPNTAGPSGATSTTATKAGIPMVYLQTLSVTLQFNCTKDQLMLFLQKVEATKKVIDIQNVSLSSDTNGALTANVGLLFYGLKPPDEVK
jgi:hypothetical protein